MLPYPLIEKYFGKIIEKRRRLSNPSSSKLLQIIDNGRGSALENLIKELEPKIGNFSLLFNITAQLNEQENPDDRIDDMIAELRGARLLNGCGYTNIMYQRKSFDFLCEKKRTKYAVEVEFIRGPSFKRQTLNHGAYNLNVAPELKKLENKIKKGFSQIPNDYKKVVIIITSDEAIDKDWFGNEIECFRKQKGREYKSKIIISSSRTIYA